MRGIRALTWLALPLAAAACVEGQGRMEPFGDGGHLSIDSAAEGTGAPPTRPDAAVIAEAGRRGGGEGAVLLGQTRVGERGETRLDPGRPLTGDPISLTIRNAPIEEAAAIVLGDALGLAYAVEPGLTGEISLRADPPVPPQELLTLFRAALFSRGLALVEAAGVYRVIRDGAAGGVAGAGGDTALFRLKNISAAEVAKALELAVPADRIRTVAGDGEAVLVTGSPEELDLARATVEALDVDALSGNSVMLVGLEYASASTLATELAAVFGGDAAPGLREGDISVRAGGLRIVPLERIGAVMLLARDNATLDRAYAWLRRLDQPRAAEAQRLFIYRVQNRPADSLSDSLNALFRGEADPDDPDAAVTPLLLRGEDPPRIVVDDEKNALVISASARQFDPLIDLIRQLDAAPLQVLVETTILEVSLGDNLRYGVQYAFSTGEIFGNDDGFVTLTTGNSPNIRPNFPGFAFTIGTGLGINAIIEALDDVSDVTVISSPKLLVRDNQSARLQVGDQVPIVTTTSQGTDVTSTIVNAVEYRDTGVTLIVSPRVNSGGYVSLTVDQEISTVSPTTTSGIDSPTISRRSVTTDVTIRDGQTVVLGGLIQESSQGGRQGIPVLSELPGVGAAFGTRSQSAGRTELLVLLRPYILTAPEQAEDVAESLRAQFEAITRMSGRRPDYRVPGRTRLPDVN